VANFAVWPQAKAYVLWLFCGVLDVLCWLLLSLAELEVKCWQFVKFIPRKRK